MIVNKTTLLFENLDAATAADMEIWVRACVLKGELPAAKSQWYIDWMEACGVDQSRELLVLSTALPQRILLSLLNYHQGK